MAMLGAERSVCKTTSPCASSTRMLVFSRHSWRRRGQQATVGMLGQEGGLLGWTA